MKLLILFFGVVLIYSCNTLKKIGLDAEHDISDKKYHSQILQATKSQSLSIIFKDSLCMVGNLPSDFKYYYQPTEQDISWINKLIASKQQGNLKLQNLPNSIFQYAGYENVAGETKIYVAVLTVEYFKRFRIFSLQKHIYFDLVVNLGQGGNYQLYNLIITKSSGDLKIEILNK